MGSTPGTPAGHCTKVHLVVRGLLYFRSTYFFRNISHFSTKLQISTKIAPKLFTMVAGVIESAATTAYTSALKTFPRKFVYGCIAGVGLLGVAATIQTQGIHDIHPALDCEPPLCKKVHCFTRMPNGATFHKRINGMASLRQTTKILIEEAQKGDSKQVKGSLRLQEEKGYVLDPQAPLHSFCKPVDSRSDSIPCRVHLDLMFETVKSA